MKCRFFIFFYLHEKCNSLLMLFFFGHMLCIYIVLLDSFFLLFFGSYKVLICVLFSTCSVSWMKIGISCWSLNRAPVWILINVKECQVIFYEVRLYFFLFVLPASSFHFLFFVRAHTTVLNMINLNWMYLRIPVTF